MADEITNETITNASADQIEAQNIKSESEKRIKQLSEKVRLTAEERDEKDNILKERDTKIAELERENAFNSGFADMLGTYTSAKEHKDEIKAKVLSGYTVEDATLAVLGKVGKLGNAQATASPAGGSAATTVTSTGNKEVKDMTQQERRAQLEKELVWQ